MPRLAVGTKVIAPEGYNFNRSLSDPILNDSLATANLGMVCGHLYGGGLTSYPLALAKGKEVWMTEHLVLDTTWVNALGTGKEIHDCMMTNMSAYVWWYIIRYYGPIHENSRVTKRGYVMSQFARFIRPGYHRVDILENPQTGVYLSAYAGDSRIVIIAINTGTKAVAQSFAVQDGVVAAFTPYVTSSSKDCIERSAINVMGGTFTATLDASSITTFVSQ
jgi:glucuronoarabinoxylan endo-1,4-beta-xylanase